MSGEIVDETVEKTARYDEARKKIQRRIETSLDPEDPTQKPMREQLLQELAATSNEGLNDFLAGLDEMRVVDYSEPTNDQHRATSLAEMTYHKPRKDSDFPFFSDVVDNEEKKSPGFEDFEELYKLSRGKAKKQVD